MAGYFNESDKERVAYLLGMLQGTLTELHDSAEEAGSDATATTAGRCLAMAVALRDKLMPGLVPGEPPEEPPFGAE